MSLMVDRLEELAKRAKGGPLPYRRIFELAASPDAVLALIKQRNLVAGSLRYFIDNHNPHKPKGDYDNALLNAINVLVQLERE